MAWRSDSTKMHPKLAREGKQYWNSVFRRPFRSVVKYLRDFKLSMAGVHALRVSQLSKHSSSRANWAILKSTDRVDSELARFERAFGRRLALAIDWWRIPTAEDTDVEVLALVGLRLSLTAAKRSGGGGKEHEGIS